MEPLANHQLEKDIGNSRQSRSIQSATLQEEDCGEYSPSGRSQTKKDQKRFLSIATGRITGLEPEPVHLGRRSITVMAANCIEAGMLATFAMLQGERAEQFLETQQVAHHWVIR